MNEFGTWIADTRQELSDDTQIAKTTWAELKQMQSVEKEKLEVSKQLHLSLNSNSWLYIYLEITGRVRKIVTPITHCCSGHLS